jgi:hypothetical protein
MAAARTVKCIEVRQLLKVLNAPNKLHGGTAMRAGGIGLVSVERVESKRVDDFASMSDEELRRFVYSTISRL